MKTTKTVFWTLTITLAFLGHVHAQSFLTNGLVAFYPFNGNANDESGNADNGVVLHATLANDRFGDSGKAYYFDGSSQIGIQAAGTFLPAASQPRTISVWLKPDNLVTNQAETWIAGGLFQYGQESGGTSLFQAQFVWQATPGLVSFYLGTESIWGWNSWIGSWDFTRWHHAVWTFDGTTNASLYVDGQEAGFESSSAGVVFNTQSGPLLIGAAGGRFFSGSLDDIRIYNRALSGSEVQQLSKYEARPQGIVTTYFNTANANEWQIAGGGATNATPYELSSGSISIISDGDSGAYVAGVTDFTGFWLADYVFYLPNGAAHISLSYSNLYVDDRGLLLLNANPIVGSGIPFFPNLNPGSLILTDGGSPQAYSSFVGPDGSVSGTVTNGFKIGGFNTLRVIINNTHSGVFGSDVPVSSGDATLLRLSGAVSYAIPAPAPIVSLIRAIKAVQPSFSTLSLGRNYQLQVSTDLNAWTNQGSPFTATNTSMIFPQYFDVDNWNQLFFRLQVAP